MILSTLFVGAALAADCTALVGDSVLLPGQGLVPGVVVIEGDFIREVTDVAPEGCEVIELAEGAVLSPAIVDARSNVGLVEVGMVRHSVDNDLGEGRVRASFSTFDSFNPASSLVAINRSSGVGTVINTPSGGRVSGVGTAMDLRGGTQADSLVREGVALYASMGGSAHASGLRALSTLFEDARTLRTRGRDFERNAMRSLAAEPDELRALLPAIDGEMPIVIGANRASDIEALLRWVEEEEVRVVLNGGAEAWVHAEALAAAEIPVMVNPLNFGPGNFDELQARPDNSALLDEAGVTVIIPSYSAHNGRKIRQIAGNAVREGMSWTSAIEGITSAPAAVFGLEDRGALRPGAAANVVIFSGDPLELSTTVSRMWLGGEEVDLGNRHKALMERYR